MLGYIEEQDQLGVLSIENLILELGGATKTSVLGYG